MGCNCKGIELVLAIVILVFALWQTTYSSWIVIIAAVLLVLHALSCKGMCGTDMSSGSARKASSGKKKKKKRR